MHPAITAQVRQDESHREKETSVRSRSKHSDLFVFLQALPPGDGSVCLISADGSNNIGIALVKSLVKSIVKKKKRKRCCVCVCVRARASERATERDRERYRVFCG